MTGAYIDPNFPNPNGPDDASIVIYGYVPTTWLAILAISLFGLLLIATCARVWRHRLWSYIPIAMGCILEIIGYSFRYLSGHVDPYRITFFIMQYFCITVAPVFIAASIYVYLSTLAAWASEQGFRTGWAGRLGRRTILWTFITADVLTTLLQITGAAMIGAKTHKHEGPSSANAILIAGLAVQTFAMIIFLGLLFHLVVSATRTEGKLSILSLKDARKSTFALCCAGTLIVLRTIFRLCESAQGVFGHLSSHEVYFGTLEFLPVVSAVAVLALCIPALLKNASAQDIDQWKPERV